MRIFFSGAPGVGKSTLVQALRRIFPDFSIYDSMSSLFMNEKQQQFTEVFQNQINIYCFNIFLNSESNIIMSRCIIDSLALNKNKVDIDYIKHILPFTIREDDFYFYIPIEFKISEREDGLRVTDESYQREIDRKIFKEMITHIPESQRFILRGSVRERIEEILKIISSYDTVKK